MNHLPTLGEIGQLFDGYHTFDELYEHRSLLFINLMRSNPKISWRALDFLDIWAFPALLCYLFSTFIFNIKAPKVSILGVIKSIACALMPQTLSTEMEAV